MTLALDLDGTLVDTAPDLIGVLNAMLAEEGLPPRPVAAARHLVGHGARRLLEHGYEEAGLSVSVAPDDPRMDRFVALYRDRIADESRPFPGVIQTLDDLAHRGARLVVCTNKRTDLSVALLSELGLADRFAAIVGPDAVSARKPSGAHAREAVLMGGGDPARAVMVGDSLTDLDAARDAGVPVVLVSFGYSDVPIAQLNADAVIDRFDQLPQAALSLLAAVA